MVKAVEIIKEVYELCNCIHILVYLDIGLFVARNSPRKQMLVDLVQHPMSHRDQGMWIRQLRRGGLVSCFRQENN